MLSKIRNSSFVAQLNRDLDEHPICAPYRVFEKKSNDAGRLAQRRSRPKWMVAIPQTFQAGRSPSYHHLEKDMGGEGLLNESSSISKFWSQLERLVNKLNRKFLAPQTGLTQVVKSSGIVHPRYPLKSPHRPLADLRLGTLSITSQDFVAIVRWWTAIFAIAFHLGKLYPDAHW